jgi:hypothetical protein
MIVYVIKKMRNAKTIFRPLGNRKGPKLFNVIPAF